ncbi:MAG: DegT/DnrJ/EryC1/StrS family aminotransferase [candidate division WOR-3 bacterium]
MKKIKLQDLYTPYTEIKEELFPLLEKIFSEMNLYLGPYQEEFEKKFAEYCGTKYFVSLSSGTDALHLALRGAGVEKDDEVILPSFTFFATLEAVWMVGAKPIFAEIKEDDFTIDPEDVRKKITKKTKAIILVHIFGTPCDMDEFWKIKENYPDIILIEDAAQAHGAIYRDKKVGNLGDVSAFSFYYTKNLGALGEAGGVSTNNKKIYEKIKLLRNHGQNKSYFSEIMGFNFRMDEIQAAILLLKLKHLDKWNSRRREIAKIYYENLKSLKEIKLIKENKEKNSVYHLFVIRTKERDKLKEYLKKEGIETGIHYPVPCHLQPAAKFYGFKEGDLKITEKISKEVLSLPSHPHLKDEEVNFICEKIKEFYL